MEYSNIAQYMHNIMYMVKSEMYRVDTTSFVQFDLISLSPPHTSISTTTDIIYMKYVGTY